MSAAKFKAEHFHGSGLVSVSLNDNYLFTLHIGTTTVVGSQYRGYTYSITVDVTQGVYVLYYCPERASINVSTPLAIPIGFTEALARVNEHLPEFIEFLDGLLEQAGKKKGGDQ